MSHNYFTKNNSTVLTLFNNNKKQIFNLLQQIYYKDKYMVNRKIVFRFSLWAINNYCTFSYKDNDSTKQREKWSLTTFKSWPLRSGWRTEFEMGLINAKIRKVRLAQGGILSDRSPVRRLEFRSRPVNVRIIGI